MRSNESQCQDRSVWASTRRAVRRKYMPRKQVRPGALCARHKGRRGTSRMTSQGRKAYLSANSLRYVLLHAVVRRLTHAAPGQAPRTAYPTKSISALAGFTTGGSTSIALRTLASGLSARNGQPVALRRCAPLGCPILPAPEPDIEHGRTTPEVLQQG